MINCYQWGFLNRLYDPQQLDPIWGKLRDQRDRGLAQMEDIFCSDEKIAGFLMFKEAMVGLPQGTAPIHCTNGVAVHSMDAKIKDQQ